MSKRFLGLLLSLCLIANSSTTALAVADDTVTAEDTQLFLTTEDEEASSDRSDSDAYAEEYEIEIPDIPISEDKKDTDPSEADTSSGTAPEEEEIQPEDAIPADDDSELIPEEETTEEEIDEEILIDPEEAAKDKQKETELPEDYYDTFPTGLINDDPGYEIESVTDGDYSLMSSGESSYPSAYTTEKLPGLKDQSPYGACWSFATDSLAEINLMKKGLKSTCDLSELHLAYFTYHWVDDPLGGFGSFRQPSSVPGVLDWGGNADFGLNTYARWTGVADETVANYKDKARTVNSSGLDESIAFEDIAHVENYYIEPIQTQNLDPVKKLIVENGAVAVSFYAVNSTSGATSSNYYNVDTNAYYNPGTRSQNHAVSVVGWDDDFSRYNFTQTPPGDGAWLVRNSWYTGRASEKNYTGYFWMSYYEGTLGSNAYAGDFALSDNFDNNYQYDTSLSPSVFGVRKAANIYTAKSGAEAEMIEAVSFYTSSSNVNYTVSIYSHLDDESDPESGVCYSEKSGSTSYAGYYTVKLDYPVRIKKGEKFAVVVEVNDEDYFFIGKERHVKVGSNTFYYDSEEGQSFYCTGTGNDWFDNEDDGNFCIKAFTTDTSYGGEVEPEEIIFRNVTDNKLEIGIEESYKVNVTVLPVESTNKKLIWTTSNPDVATVTNGRINGIDEGTATITAIAELGGVHEKIEVTVKPKLLSIYIYATSSTGSVVEGEDVTLTAMPTPSDYTYKGDVTWSFSDESILSQDILKRVSERRVKAKPKKPGMVKVTASSEDVTFTRNLYCTPKPSYFTYEILNDNTIEFSFDAIPGATVYEFWRDNKQITEVLPDGSDQVTCRIDEFKGTSFGSVTYKVRTYYDYTYVTTSVTVVSPYIIRYHLNGANQNPLNPGNYFPGSEYILYPPEAPALHEFEGWFLDEGFTQPIEKITADMSGDLDIYAKMTSYRSTAITLTSDSDRMSPGQEMILSVKVLPETLDQLFDWQSSIVPSDAATITRNETEFTVSAIKPGTVYVTVTNNSNMTANKTIHIVDIYPEDIVLTSDKGDASEAESKCSVGDVITVTASILPDDANDKKVSWEISDEDILTLKTSGDTSATVMAKAEGTAYVYAVSNADKAIRHGHRIVVGSEGSFVTEGATELRLIDTGKVPKLYGSSSDKPTKTLYGSVADGSSMNVDISNTASDKTFYELSLAIGKSFTLKPDFLPKADKSTAKKEAYGDSVTNKNVSWSSGNTAIATVAGGKITAKGSGTTVITATSEENSLVTACRITVYEPVTGITLDKTSVKLGTGQTGELSVVSMQPITATDSFTFSVNRPDLVKIDQKDDDTVTFKALGGSGNAVITVTADQSKKSAKCNVTVGTPVKTISVAGKGGVTAVPIGKPLQLVTTFNGGGAQPVNKEVKYEILGDTTVARVSQKGVLTPLRDGYVTVRVSSTTDDAAGNATFLVYSAMKSASLDHKSVTIDPRTKGTVSVVVTPSDKSCSYVTGKNYGEDVLDDIKWDKDSPYIDLKELEGGKCEIISRVPNAQMDKTFTATVTATITPFGATSPVTLTCNVTLKKAVITGMNLDATKLSMNRGDVKEITATLTPVAPYSSQIFWMIDEKYSNIITFVDAYGKDQGNTVFTDHRSGNNVFVKAKDKKYTGSEKAVIIAMVYGETASRKNIAKQISVTVGNQAGYAEILSGKNAVKKLQVATGKSSTLKAAVYSDSSKSAKAGSQAVVWKSKNENIVSVSSAGKVTGITTGTARVYATISGKTLDETSDAYVDVTVYNPAKKVSLDKTKLSMSTYVDESSTRQSSFSHFSALTPSVTPAEVFENENGNGLITWSISGTGKVLVTSVGTEILKKQSNIYEKQKFLSGLEYSDKISFTTKQGESLAFKAISPGNVKITASVLGKSTSCNVTIYTHVEDFNLSAPIKDKAGNVILKPVTGESYGYAAELATKGTKSVTLKPLVDFQGAEYSDSKGSPATTLYNFTKKYIVNTQVTYRSTNPKIASVSAKGAVTAKSAGSCYIVVSTVEGNIQKKIKVTVK